ncbi:hypothetical protein [Eisenbergiella sp.]
MRYDVVLSWRQEQDGATVYSTTHGLQGGDMGSSIQLLTAIEKQNSAVERKTPIQIIFLALASKWSILYLGRKNQKTDNKPVFWFFLFWLKVGKTLPYLRTL